ncbi:MAG: ThuA domain-containing protein [Anaerolineales bacterium]
MKAKRVLVLCDDEWHPARIPREGLTALKQNDFPFDWIENAHDWSAERMASYPLVILTKSNHVSSSDRSNWMTEEVQEAFENHIHNGCGLLAIHSGTAGYEQTSVLRSLLGGVFTHHPEQCLVKMEPKAGHSLTEGVNSFMLIDEHYHMAMDDPQADIFLTTSSKHGKQPSGWRRTEGNGRVAVLTPGHNLDVWQHPDFQTLLLNSLRWCGKIS